jgi:hypothetical protein
MERRPLDPNRCTDLPIGQKILSYDLLVGEEKRAMDAHLEGCAACRDFKLQVFGEQGALDELNYRAWKLGQRQNVGASWWLATRLRDLWLPILLILGVGTAVFVFLATRSGSRESVRVLRFAVSRGATLDSLASPSLDVGPNGVILRTDRDARAYVYEIREGTMRRLVPGGTQPPPEVGRLEATELPLPPIEASDVRLLLLLVPTEAPGTVEEWDAAVFAELSRGKNPSTSAAGWPGQVRPALRWYP